MVNEPQICSRTRVPPTVPSVLRRAPPSSKASPLKKTTRLPTVVNEEAKAAGSSWSFTVDCEVPPEDHTAHAAEKTTRDPAAAACRGLGERAGAKGMGAAKCVVG